MLAPAVVGGLIALGVILFCLCIVGLCLCVFVFCRKERKGRDVVPAAIGHVPPNRPAALAERGPKLGADSAAYPLPDRVGVHEPGVDVIVGADSALVFGLTRSGPADEVRYPRMPIADVMPSSHIIEDTACPPDSASAYVLSDRVALADVERRRLVESLIHRARELAERHAYEEDEAGRCATQASWEIKSSGRHSKLTDRHFSESSRATEAAKAEAEGLEESLVGRFGYTPTSHPAEALALRFQSAYAAHRRALRSGLARGPADPSVYAHGPAVPVQASAEGGQLRENRPMYPCLYCMQQESQLYPTSPRAAARRSPLSELRSSGRVATPPEATWRAATAGSPQTRSPSPPFSQQLDLRFAATEVTAAQRRASMRQARRTVELAQRRRAARAHTAATEEPGHPLGLAAHAPPPFVPFSSVGPNVVR